MHQFYLKICASIDFSCFGGHRKLALISGATGSLPVLLKKIFTCVLSTVLQTSSGVVAAAAIAPAAAPDTACASGLYVRFGFSRDWHASYVTKWSA